MGKKAAEPERESASVSVRITRDQFREVEQLKDASPGTSINGWVQRALANFISDELPVRLEAARKLEQTLRK